MFASLKNKIKEETGSDIPSIQNRPLSNRYQRSRLGSITSTASIEDLTVIEQVWPFQTVFMCYALD